MTWWEALGVVWGLSLAAGLLLLLPRGESPLGRLAPATPEVTDAGSGSGTGAGAVSPGVRHASKPSQTRVAGRVLARLQQSLDQAGWGGLRAPVVIALWSVVSLIIGALVGVLIPIPILMPLALFASGLGGQAVLRGRIEARQRRLRAAWPGLVDHVRQVIRSGGQVAEAVAGLEHHSPEELRAFFADFGRAVESGARVDSALAQLKDDVADPVADRIIEALRMAHEVGGRELPGVLHSLQASVRADIAVREDALAKQSWIRAASRLGVAAPWLVLVVLSGRTETLQAYDSAAGVAIIVAGALFSVLAYRMMSRLGRLPVDQRWFANESPGARS
ncbi:type II secretion system F family protein [Pontimonas sp.]|uniref:type II secretion system F family protein n=1 Tax=Pontimonas sp. TaxID=2304492 RepID=UPI0028709129|nr:type II secretion system F family protein [Pontimonas sp.]MDR9397031.1 type II secretion system protein F [Pontimonas sp.]